MSTAAAAQAKADVLVKKPPPSYNEVVPYRQKPTLSLSADGVPLPVDSAAAAADQAGLVSFWGGGVVSNLEPL